MIHLSSSERVHGDAPTILASAPELEVLVLPFSRELENHRLQVELAVTL
jgi:hypothetical protein